MDISDRKPSSTVRLLVLALLAAPLLAGGVGCEAAENAAASVVLPPQKEEALGDKSEKEFLAKDENELYQGQQVNNYIEKLGRRAVEAAKKDSPEAIEYEFKVLDAPEQVNAFAMPGGQIFFYTGLLKMAETEAQVMSVMCHEVAHVSKRHIAKRLVKAYGLQALTQAAIGENPGLVEKLVAQIVQTGAMLKFSREDEKEADSVGVKYCIDAGYDPHGFVEFFSKLQKQREGVQIKWLSSHPLPKDRVEAAEEQIGDRSFENARVGRQAHQEILDALKNGGNTDPPAPDAGFDDAGGADRPEAGM